MADERRLARYQRIFLQLEDLIQGKSPGLISAMATITAVLHHKMPHHSWTGFYLARPGRELHVGPYQGLVACQVLRDQGVCRHAVETGKPVVVPDVEAFPGHIACDARSKSEIVVPMLKGGEVTAVLDIDSTEPAQFDKEDVAPLEKILSLLTPFL